MDMMALLLARAMAGGGNGGGAQPDWNAAEGEPGHVLNRTHYEENAEVEFFPETTLVGEGGQFAIEGELPFVIDQTYAVYFNGTRYECKCYSITYEGIVMTGVGNSAILGMPGAVDTGEPFTVGVVPAMQPGATLVIDSTGGTTCTLAISAVEKVVHHLPNKYIKDMYGEEVKEVNITFNGDTTGRELLQPGNGGTYVKVSDIVPTLDEVKAGSIILSAEADRQTLTLEEYAARAGQTIDELVIQENGAVLVNSGPEIIIVVSKAVTYGLVSFTPGTYFIVLGSAYIAGLSYSHKEIHAVPAKYIKDMYYEEKSVGAVILSEMVDEVSNLTYTLPLEEGKTYAVTVNGTEYQAVCKAKEEALALGNTKVFDDDDTGEPFFVITNPSNNVSQVGNYAYAEIGSVLITVAPGGTEIHRIPQKYLPEIPFFDLAAMGLPNIPMDKTVVKCEVGESATAIRAALGKGSIKVRFALDYSGTTAYGTVVLNPMYIEMLDEYSAAFVGVLMGQLLAIDFIFGGTGEIGATCHKIAT